MASFICETAAQLFSRIEQNKCYIPLEEHLLPQLTTQDVVEIAGGPGSGKTELLYHLIVHCILPDTPWKGLDLEGLNKKVMLINNDLHFNLFRLMKILERRLRYLLVANNISVNITDISTFINERLKLLDILKCTNCDEFICSLKYLELAQNQKYVLMIDGIMSFYWSSKMRMSYPTAKIPDSMCVVISLLKNIIKNCNLPVIITKRNLVSSPSYDRSLLPAAWRNLVTKKLELVFEGCNEKSSNITVLNISSGVKVRCAISNSGFKICY
ncbi:DNA repair protein XRCC2-like [Argiope bruennichi]|uniref:DNA repair protein XRCC2 like protein n=1 Tax=Argiope bruennichi TaxID=94029 RepID=A0A8T0FHD4_ARGBR|nr:DNA repair protein XRCC2-like [Argiope bruennichi]KAF8788283.1 DNA repair protein XRCC2 like protein [Argiope bruennichi]